MPATKTPVPAQENPGPRPLNAYGPDGQVIAVSLDGGKTFGRTKEGVALDADRRRLLVEGQPVPVTRRIAAVVEEATPSVQRRLFAGFEAMRPLGILAGWGPYDAVAACDPAELDLVVVPNLAVAPEQVAALKARFGRVVLDLDEPATWTTPARGYPAEGGFSEVLGRAAAVADAVLVPTDRIAQEIRRYHPTVFSVPSLLDARRWAGVTRGERGPGAPVRIGLCGGAEALPPGLLEAIGDVQGRYGAERVEVVPYDWRAITAEEEPSFYHGLDVVAIGELGNADGPYRLQAAMAGGCAIVGGKGLYRHVQHGHSALLHGRGGEVVAWRGHVHKLVVDGRYRAMLGRNAKAAVRRWSAARLLNQVATPYQVLAPARRG